MTSNSTDSAVQGLLQTLHRLRAQGVLLFGVRHHSPACAHHLRRAIEALQPKSVLIEGPPELGGLVGLMVHPDARPPFAAYCAHEDGTGRHAAYYPFCEASPELVAVREGHRIGAEVRFVDLGFPVTCRRRKVPGTRGARRRLDSLLEEAHLARSAYLAALARRTGCRDQDELWDHLFEARAPDLPWTDFVDEVATYCLMARRDHAEAVLEADGSLIRERAMTLATRAAIEAGGPVVVVTGGFHTPQIAAWLDAGTALEAPPDERCDPVLIRYGFAQLDALNGYASGMPSAAFQDALARAYGRQEGSPQQAAAGELLVEVAREARQTGAFVANAAEEVAALVQADRLAALRGRAAVTRTDVQEALLSTLSKGPKDVEGALVAKVVRRVFTGTVVGRVPDAAGAPPIVEDFLRRAKALKVEAPSGAREVDLSIYQRAPHREASRFLHALVFLEVPYAKCLAGPDFVRGEGLHRRRERWRLRWTPDVDAALVEASVYGDTVAQAAAGRLEEAAAALAEAGRGKDAEAAVGLYVQALAMGARGALEALGPVVAGHVRADPRFERVVRALIGLVLALEGREPLEAFEEDGPRALAVQAFLRTVALVPEAARAPEARVEETAAALASLRQLGASAALEAQLGALTEAVARAAGAREGHPRLQGALTGLAYGFGRLDAAAVADRVRGHLVGTSSDPEAKVAFLSGVLETAREAAWRVPELVQGLDGLLLEWDEATFMRALPTLRMAFAALTPREVDRVAAAVAPNEGALAPEAGPAFELDRLVQDALRADGLIEWARHE